VSSQWTTGEHRPRPAIATVWAGAVLCATLLAAACWVAFADQPAPAERPAITFNAGTNDVTISRGTPGEFSPGWCDQTDLQADGTVICWHAEQLFGGES
jgi:hypothetical protein